ncbi:MAG: lipid A deacylase LpxR family protein [Pedobacter sp.]|nr:MAG: lipid A deacylase LpxR family protein [Pedobacter sp.]
MIRFIFVFIFVFAFNMLKVKAQEVDSTNYKSEFGFKSDNDAYLFYGQDQYYTNGLFISYKQALRPKYLNAKLENKIWSLSISQEMFNPRSGFSPLVELHDRPFAASLFVSYDEIKYKKTHSVFNWGIDLGIIGPDALGEDAQKVLHNTVGFYQIAGWEYQIQNAFLAQLRLAYLKRLGVNSAEKVDMSMGTSLNVGTIHNQASLNLLFRAGKIYSITRSTITNGHLNNDNNSPKSFLESFFYLKPQISYVATNATLEGNLFNDNSPVTFNPKPWVFSAQVGYQFTLKRFRFDYHWIFNSREVKSKALPHQYGSISIFYLFNKN